MRDPQLIDPAEPRIPDEWRRAYLNRPIERLPRDVTLAFDRLWTIEREKDEMRGELLAAKDQLHWADLKIWILMLVVGGEGAIIGWLVKDFLARLR